MMNRPCPKLSAHAPMLLVLSLAILCLISCPSQAANDDVTLLKTPNGGIQPQAVLDSSGTLHLIYFQGDPPHGDIFYVHKKMGTTDSFSAPIRVNSVRGSAMAVGTIRGAQLAVGKAGRVYVTWNGVGVKGSNGYPRLTVAFTRLNETRTGFEPQKDLLPAAEEVDGGGSVAADDKGNVYVTWHLSPPGKEEAAGGVYLIRSTDEGKTFTSEKRISAPQTGQCGCCSMRAFVDHTGTLSILYRSAGGGFNRDTTLLVSQDAGQTFRSAVLSPWKLGACPMTSFSLSEGRGEVLGAWETAGQVYYSRLNGTQTAPTTPAPGTGSRKYPVIVRSEAGKTLFAWVEGAGWQRGGALAWQVYDQSGRPEGGTGRADGVPTWSLVTAVARPDGGFLLIY